MRIELIVDEYNTKMWFENGVRHRLDGPAIIYEDGSKFFYWEGEEIDSILADDDDENYL